MRGCGWWALRKGEGPLLEKGDLGADRALTGAVTGELFWRAIGLLGRDGDAKPGDLVTLFKGDFPDLPKIRAAGDLAGCLKGEVAGEGNCSEGATVEAVAFGRLGVPRTGETPPDIFRSVT